MSSLAEEEAAGGWIMLDDGRKVFLDRSELSDNEGAGQPDESGKDKRELSGGQGYELTDKVKGVWGSTAGAGSDFFHVYRRLREREMIRVETMEKEFLSKEEDRIFQEQRTRKILEAKQQTEARAAKRKRRKQKRIETGRMKKKFKKDSKDKIEGDNSHSDSEEDNSEVEISPMIKPEAPSNLKIDEIRKIETAESFKAADQNAPSPEASNITEAVPVRAESDEEASVDKLNVYKKSVIDVGDIDCPPDFEGVEEFVIGPTTKSMQTKTT